MNAIGVIPARWASTRLPGKVLIDICGKPMLQHVWERARQCRELSEVIIACDEEHVFRRCEAFGARVVMTRKDHVSGSDRIAEVAAGLDAEIIVNIQGDEPLIDPGLVDGLVKEFDHTSAPVTTAVKSIKDAAEFLNPNVVKVVFDANGDALYFSRSPIPFHRDGEIKDFSRYFRHLGIYAYRKDFLLMYCRWGKSFLEAEESLEQLRVLEGGYGIRCVVTDMETVGVDAPEDVLRVIGLLKGKN